MGGEIGMGNTCKPMAVSFQCMTKSTTNKKKKKESACIRKKKKRYKVKIKIIVIEGAKTKLIYTWKLVGRALKYSFIRSYSY